MFRFIIACLTVCILGAAFTQPTDAAVVFDINHSNMVVEGMINGAILEPTPVPANTADGLSGVIVVVVNDYANPTAIQIVDGTMDVETNIGDGPFRPGIGGSDSSAYGDFAFQATTNEVIELAIRDLTIDFSSGLLPLSGGSVFDADQVSMLVGSGALDILSPSMGGNRYDMGGLPATTSEEAMGTLVQNQVSGNYQIAMTYERTIDISGLSDSIAGGSYLKLSGTIVAEAEDIPEPSTFTALMCMSVAGIFLSGRRKQSRS